MVYTVTFNPSLDYVISVSKFAPGKTNRGEDEQLFVGGKGINVSIVLSSLGIQSRTLGFTAGFTGKEIEHQVKTLGIDSDFIAVQNGFSRINVKLKNMDGTEINGSGPVLTDSDADRLMQKLDMLKTGDVLVLAGSIPKSLPDDIYSRILKRLDGRGVLFVVDAEKDLLLNVLPYRPFLIKPNHHELGDIFDVSLKTRAEVVPYTEKLKAMGAQNVLVSMAGEGAVLLADDGSVHMLGAPCGKLISGVGAGDSMVAGFIAGWLKTGSYDDAFRLSVASGSATAFSEFLADRDKIEEVLAKL